MNEVSLIDGHIDDTKFTCKDCSNRHYNCHSECETYKRRKESVRKATVDRDTKIEMEKKVDRYEYTALMRRGNYIKGRHK